MQRDLKSIEDAGVQVVGISYDDAAVLKKFSDRMKIAFPLLSDPESKTIDAYHIRNEAAKGKAEGVPNPGTFILDQAGRDPRSSSSKGFATATRRKHLSRRRRPSSDPLPPNDEETDDAEAGLALAACGMIARLFLACLGRAVARRSGRGTPTSPCRRSAIAHPSLVGLPRQEGAA